MSDEIGFEFAKQVKAGPGAGLERLSGRARLLQGTLQRHLGALDGLLTGGGQRALAKQIAVVTLGLELECGARRRMALGVAALTVAREFGVGEGMRRKATSEARALLDYGLGDLDLLGLPGVGTCPLTMVEQLDALVDAVNLRDATSARAACSRDVRRGGAAPHPDMIGEVERLLRRGEAGDAGAALQLRGLARRLQAWI